MSKHKTTNKVIKLPDVPEQNLKGTKTLPYNEKAVLGKGFSFSFACFDRDHKLFNLGDNTGDKVVSGKWFLDLLDCFKSVSNKNINELKRSMHDLHPICWEKANAAAPINAEQYEYWQFRINKSKGRVIGFLIEDVFYVLWLDPHHNLTDSEGYGGVRRYNKPKSQFEEMEEEIERLKKEIARLEKDKKEYEELLKDAE